MTGKGPIAIKTPITLKALRRLRTGNRVFITGVVYTARDAAHQRMRAAQAGAPEAPEGSRELSRLHISGAF